jgi:Plasmid pRiA4b ORF-3-like protein
MADAGTHIFRVSLAARLYRDIEISSTSKLYDLARYIVRVFDFDFDHAFGFYSNLKGNIYASPIKYELFADMGESDARSVKRTRISEAFPSAGRGMTFLFDYGDGWQFRVKATGFGKKERSVTYPRLLKSVGDAPEQYPSAEDDG